MKEGKVKWFSVPKGYGFIAGDDGVDVFVHFSGIVSEGFRTLRPDQRVAYEVKEDEKGRPVACNVEVLAAPAAE